MKSPGPGIPSEGCVPGVIVCLKNSPILPFLLLLSEQLTGKGSKGIYFESVAVKESHSSANMDIQRATSTAQVSEAVKAKRKAADKYKTL